MKLRRHGVNPDDESANYQEPDTEFDARAAQKAQANRF
jgi:hypothetical protein